MSTDDSRPPRSARSADPRTPSRESKGQTRRAPQREAAGFTTAPLHDVCLAAAEGRAIGERGFHRRGRLQRRSPIKVRGRLPELRRRASPPLIACDIKLP